MSHNSALYQPQEVLKRVTDSEYYVDEWAALYKSGTLEYDIRIVEFSITFDRNPVGPKHRITVIPQNGVTPIEIYPYEGASGEATISSDIVGLYPELSIPQGSSFKLEVYATTADSSQATLDYLELVELR